MPTYTFDERTRVCAAMDATGTARCPRCGSPVDTHRLRTSQDKVLNRPGKPLYRCSNVRCALECTPTSHMTIAPSDSGKRSPPTGSAPPGG